MGMGMGRLKLQTKTKIKQARNKKHRQGPKIIGKRPMADGAARGALALGCLALPLACP